MLKDFLQGKPFRHPLHTFLVHFPLGFFFFSLVLDLASLATTESGLVRIAYYCMVLGIITALTAAIPGFVDYIDIRKDRPGRRIATAHMILNLVAVGVYAINVGLRASHLDDAKTPSVPLLL